MSEFLISPEDSMKAYQQTQYLIKHAQEILSTRIPKARRKEIESVLECSIGRARKMLHSSRMKGIEGIQEEQVNSMNPDAFFSLTWYQKIHMRLSRIITKLLKN